MKKKKKKEETYNMIVLIEPQLKMTYYCTDLTWDNNDLYSYLYTIRVRIRLLHYWRKRPDRTPTGWNFIFIGYQLT